MKLNSALIDKSQFIKNTNNDSREDTYSCEFINKITKDIYSTSETKTNKVDKNGKPIYRIRIESLFTGTQTSKMTSLASLGINNVRNIETLKSISDHEPIEEDYYAGSNDYLRTFINSAGLNIMIGSSYPAKPVNIYTTIEYSKTTD